MEHEDWKFKHPQNYVQSIHPKSNSLLCWTINLFSCYFWILPSSSSISYHVLLMFLLVCCPDPHDESMNIALSRFPSSRNFDVFLHCLVAFFFTLEICNDFNQNHSTWHLMEWHPLPCNWIISLAPFPFCLKTDCDKHVSFNLGINFLKLWHCNAHVRCTCMEAWHHLTSLITGFEDSHKASFCSVKDAIHEAWL